MRTQAIEEDDQQAEEENKTINEVSLIHSDRVAASQRAGI